MWITPAMWGFCIKKYRLFFNLLSLLCKNSFTEGTKSDRVLFLELSRSVLFDVNTAKAVQAGKGPDTARLEANHTLANLIVKSRCNWQSVSFLVGRIEEKGAVLEGDINTDSLIVVHRKFQRSIFCPAVSRRTFLGSSTYSTWVKLAYFRLGAHALIWFCSAGLLLSPNFSGVVTAAEIRLGLV